MRTSYSQHQTSSSSALFHPTVSVSETCCITISPVPRATCCIMWYPSLCPFKHIFSQRHLEPHNASTVIQTNVAEQLHSNLWKHLKALQPDPVAEWGGLRKVGPEICSETPGALYTDPSRNLFMKSKSSCFHSSKSLRFHKPNIHSCQLAFTVHRC